MKPFNALTLDFIEQPETKVSVDGQGVFRRVRVLLRECEAAVICRNNHDAQPQQRHQPGVFPIRGLNPGEKACPQFSDYL
jgi:hypothetical protein